MSEIVRVNDKNSYEARLVAVASNVREAEKPVYDVRDPLTSVRDAIQKQITDGNTVWIQNDTVGTTLVMSPWYKKEEGESGLQAKGIRVSIVTTERDTETLRFTDSFATFSFRQEWDKIGIKFCDDAGNESLNFRVKEEQGTFAIGTYRRELGDHAVTLPAITLKDVRESSEKLSHGVYKAKNVRTVRSVQEHATVLYKK